jgi:hypothetical protein
MKKILLVSVIAAVLAATAGDLRAIEGTWSGNWAPKGGTLDAITVELRIDEAGKLAGRFVTPARMDFSKASFNPSTQTIDVQATDAKTGKVYKIEGKIKGTELIGTLAANDTTGEVRLIKWTFFAR